MRREENFGMTTVAWKAVVIAAALGFMILPATCFAQSEEELENERVQREAAVQAQHEAEARQTEEMIQQGQSRLNDFLNDGQLPPRPLSPEASQKARFRDFRQAIPKFRNATASLRWAVGSTAKIEAPAKEIAAQTTILLKYLEGEKLKHPRLDSSEFKDYSREELVWETLNSAERISKYLDIAVRAEQQQVVTTKTLEFLYTLDGELLRLKWLTGHVR
jgi:hypothetical protein